MRVHPSIEIVARDRAEAYSEAVDIALPAAKQVSDRWHLLSNLRDNVERLLYRLGPQLRQAAQQVNVSKVNLGRQGIPSPNSQRSWERLSDQRRATRLALYKQVMALRAQGGSMKGIARELSIDQRTVRRFVTGGGSFPERVPKARSPTPLDPYRDYIEERIVQGCRFPEVIRQELKQRGYLG
ncbi:transposase [Cupriavidus basilensis]|uniref:transposase n=1 Tax=Cupriavidus basilensis TaxID=68895 RepID=UPI001F50948E|nr:transposase [Cupriavidus basilensis]